MDFPLPPKYQQSIDRLVVSVLKDLETTSISALHDINAGLQNSPYAYFVCGMIAKEMGRNHLAAEAFFKCADFYGLANETQAWALANYPAYTELLNADTITLSADAGDDDAYGTIVDGFADRYVDSAELFMEQGTEKWKQAEQTLMNLFCMQQPFLFPFRPAFEIQEALDADEDTYHGEMSRFLKDKEAFDTATNRAAQIPHHKNEARSSFLKTVAGKLQKVSHPLRILDFGSSSGRNIDEFYRMIHATSGAAPVIHGIDPDAGAIAEMRTERPHLIGHVGNHDCLTERFSEARFDLMIASSVLHSLPPHVVEKVIAFAGGNCDAVAFLDYPSNFAGDKAIPRCLGEPFHILHPFRKLLAESGFSKFEIEGFHRPLRAYAAGIYAAKPGSPFVH